MKQLQLVSGVNSQAEGNSEATTIGNSGEQSS